MRFPRILETIYIDGNYNISNNGIGSLPDCLSCYVTEILNDKFVLSLSYPIGGFNWKELKVGRFIVCKPNLTDAEQPFRIVKVNRSANKKIDVEAEHISYDLSRILTEGFNAGNSTKFLIGVDDYSIDSTGNKMPFKITSDISKSGTYLQQRKPPRTLKSVLMDTNSSFLSLFGGELYYDGLNVSILANRGIDRGFKLNVKNLLSLSETFSIRDYATACYPYWAKEVDGFETLVVLPEKVLHFGASEYSDVERLVSLDLSSNFENPPTVEELRNEATKWINSNFQLNVPHTVSVKCKINKNDDVRLGDIVTVSYKDFDLVEKMKVIEYKYNVLLDECDQINAGDPLPKFENTILKLAGGKKIDYRKSNIG